MIDESQIRAFVRDGFVSPLPALSAAEASDARRAVISHLTGSSAAERYELTDDIRVGRSAASITSASGAPEFEYLDEPAIPTLRELPFLFNLWKVDETFWRLANHPRLVAYARAFLRSDDILLFEDNVVVKLGGAKAVPWHQDYSYWPFGEPSALTIWIALNPISPANGAMRMAPGTQVLGERLPVKFKNGASFMDQARPGIPPMPSEVRDRPTVTYQLEAGECGIHDAMVWHGSTPNETDGSRCALVLRYVKAGTLWLGSTRIPYDDVGCEVGARLTSEHFPAVGVGGEFMLRRR